MVTGFSIGIKENSQDLTNNSTNVTVSLMIVWNGGSYNATGNAAGTLKIDGIEYSFTAKFNEAQKTSGSEVIYTKILNIAHSADGTKSLSCSASFATGTMAGTVTATATKKLTQIPRESTISATDANVGAVSMISINRKNTAYTHSVAYSFGKLSGYLADAGGTHSSSEVKISAVNLSFLIPQSFYTQIHDCKKGYCKLTVRTYNGNTQIGAANSYIFTVTAAESNCRPQVTGTVTDSNEYTVALTGNANKLVQGMSIACCTISAQPMYSAYLTKKAIGGVTVTGDQRTIPGIENNHFVFSATDSRGYTGTYEKTVEMVRYIPLTCNASAVRLGPTDGKAVVKVSGNYFNGSFGAQANSLRVTCKIGNMSPVLIQPTVTGNTYVATLNLQNMDYQTAYDITVTVQDKLIGVAKKVTLSKGLPVFDWGEGDFNFNVPVSIKGIPLRSRISSLEQLDEFAFSDNYFRMGYGVVDNNGYLSFNIGWIVLQFKVTPGNAVYKRVKYGSNSWSDWTQI